jgi:hypothetical protein
MTFGIASFLNVCAIALAPPYDDVMALSRSYKRKRVGRKWET